MQTQAILTAACRAHDIEQCWGVSQHVCAPQALVNAGCERRLLADAYRKKSPLRGADVRWVCSLPPQAFLMKGFLEHDVHWMSFLL